MYKGVKYMDAVKLSNRLKQASQYVKSGAYFADIGSDHAYLPIYICQQDESAKGIAGELNQGPFDAAKAHVKGYNLNDRIDVIKGNGLTVIGSETVDTVVICGMGGGLIRSILDEGKSYLTYAKRLILQPNIDSHYLREWLVDNQYKIVAEEIMKEDGHIYEIIVADQTEEPYQLSTRACYFGPYLLQELSDVFKEKWQREYDNIMRIIQNMQKAKHVDERKLQQFIERKQWIEEVLIDE